MKKIFFLLLSLFAFACFVYSQTSIGVENDLKGVMASGGNVMHTTISAFNSPEIKGKRYVFDTWTPGSIISITGTIYSSNYSFNLDKVSQELYASLDKDHNSVLLLDKSKIKRFTAGPVSFVSSVSLKGSTPGYFYQVLVEDSTKYSLYKLTTTKFVKANPNDIMNARTGNLASEYVDDDKYFISLKNDELKKINLSENSIRKALKEKNDKVDAYFNANLNKDVDQFFLINMIKYINQ